MVLAKLSGLSPAGIRHELVSVPTRTPVTFDFTHSKFNPTLWLACKAARQSNRCRKFTHACFSVASALNTCLACSFVSSFVSSSAFTAGESPVGFGSFLPIHFKGLLEWVFEPPPAAVAAPAPAGPCADACAGTNDKAKTAVVAHFRIVFVKIFMELLCPPRDRISAQNSLQQFRQRATVRGTWNFDTFTTPRCDAQFQPGWKSTPTMRHLVRWYSSLANFTSEAAAI